MTAISFIIPARNEAGLIAQAIENIRAFAPSQTRWELIIVDNGSTDGTIGIAQRHGDVRVLQAQGTVGAARNIGAASAQEDILVFLDADVRLTARWQSNIRHVLSAFLVSPRLITGSTVGIPPQPTTIEKHWFNPATRTPRRYINSGHLIVGKAFFHGLGGFDARLVTGEDFEFCDRARANGGEVRDDPALEVVHLGFPKTLAEFARRELWHGQGDGGTIRRILDSRVAVASLAVFLITCAGPVVAWVAHSWIPLYCCLGAGLLTAAVLSVRRSVGTSAMAIAFNTGLYYVYLQCRGAALFIRRGGWRDRS